MLVQIPLKSEGVGEFLELSWVCEDRKCSGAIEQWMVWSGHVLGTDRSRRNIRPTLSLGNPDDDQGLSQVRHGPRLLYMYSVLYTVWKSCYRRQQSA